MKPKLQLDIRKSAEKVRTRDFIWASAIGAVLMLALVVSSSPFRWWQPLLVWGFFVAALYVRYLASPSRQWAEPVQTVVEAELSAREAELEKLNLAFGVAQALPDPLFILNRSGLIEYANPAAVAFFEMNEPQGRHVATVVRAPAVFEAAEKVTGGEPAMTVDFTTMGSIERYCQAFVTPLGDEMDDNLGAERLLLYIRDLTSEQRVEQMRADFIASASHELRTPLASLLGFIETLRGHARDDPEAQDKFLAIMQTQAERMQRLVSDLMSLSRIELNEHVPPRARVDLCAISQDLIEGMGPLTDASNTIIDYDCPCGDSVLVVGDADEMTQALQNLVDNALKYGGEPALIKVNVGIGEAPSLAAEGEIAHRAGDNVGQLAARQGLAIDDFAFVQVRDFGPGIDRGNLPRLTERFYRVNIERSRKSGGTGLGLAIVKHITNRHKGGLQVESRLAAGSAFTCYFHRADAEKNFPETLAKSAKIAQ